MQLKLKEFVKFKKNNFKGKLLKQSSINNRNIFHLYRNNELKKNTVFFSNLKRNFDFENMFMKDTFAMKTLGSSGKVFWINENFHSVNPVLININSGNSITNKYLYFFLKSKYLYLNNLAKQSYSSYPILKIQQIENLKINLPDFNKKIFVVNELDFINKIIILNNKIISLLNKIINLKILILFKNIEKNYQNNHKISDYFLFKKDKFLKFYSYYNFSEINFKDFNYLKSKDLKSFYLNEIKNLKKNNISEFLRGKEKLQKNTIVSSWYGDWVGYFSFLKKDVDFHEFYLFNLIFKYENTFLNKCLFLNLIYKKNHFQNLSSQTGTANLFLTEEQILNFKLFNLNNFEKVQNVMSVDKIYSFIDYEAFLQKETQIYQKIFENKMFIHYK